MADKHEFDIINFNNEHFIVVQKIQDSNLGEILLCMGEEGRVYINNNEFIDSQEIIDELDEKYWRSPNSRGRVEQQPIRNSIREIIKSESYDR